MTFKLLFLLAFATIVSSSMLAGCSSSTSPSSNGGSGSGGGGLFVPDTVNFGSVANGQTKDTVISIFNETSSAITITGSSLSSSQAKDTNFSHPVSVAPGYINVHIEFTPSSSGINSAVDSIHYQSAGKTYTAAMTLEANTSGGTGGNTGSLFGPTKVDFGLIPIGQWHDTMIVLGNTGTGPLTILSSSMNSIEAQDTNFLDSVTISAGGYTMIHLQFNPNQAGPQTAVDTLHYLTGSTLRTSTITLTAVGGAPSNTPGPGSMYTYDYSAIDTNGVTGPHSDSTYTIVTNSLTFAGKTDVVEAQNSDGNISYYHLESNGDLSVYVDLSNIPFPIGASSAWFVIPIGSKVAQSTTLFDSTIQYPYNGSSIPVAVSITSTSKDMGPATINIPGHSFPSEKGSLSVSVTASAFGGFVTLASQVVTATIWYSKQLKYYPERQDAIVNSGVILGNTTSSDTYLLKSYSLK